jgi:6-phosphogluconolactonase
VTPRHPSFEIAEDPARRAAERLAEAANAGGHIALTGGSTPRSAYETLAALDVNWPGVSLWWGDERCVPPDDERSNFGMARAALLDRIEPPGPTIHRIEGEREESCAAADAYEDELRDAFGADGPPQLDLVLLGLGPDAHVASLFPGQTSLDVTDRLAVAVEEPGLAPWVARVSLTLPVLNAGREVLFLVTGEDKAEAVERAFVAPPARDAPGSLIAPESGRLTVILDEAAAARVPAQAREGG